MFLFLSVWLFLSFIQTGFQTTYPCDPTTSCGCSANPASVTKIIGGENAPNDTWGWAVSILIDNEWMCGGSILTSSWILTAAHCVANAYPENVLVSAGTNRLFGFYEIRFGSSIMVHPEYDPELLVNDIALIEVSPPFNMTDRKISRICLPDPTTDLYPSINSTVVAVGWGLTSDNGDESLLLQQVTLTVTSPNEFSCYYLISNASLQFCASIRNDIQGTCSGDSGGPVMMFTASNRWVVVGIVSYGFECANPYMDDVYTRVAYYLDWIRSMNVTDVTTTTYYSMPTVSINTTLSNSKQSSYDQTSNIFLVLAVLLPSLLHIL